MGSKIRLFGSLARALPAYLKKNTKCAHLPTRAWIDVSSVCNLRCQMCPNRMCPPSEKGFMDYNLFVKAIDQLSEFAFDVNLFLSGEPLLHPEIVRMISYAKLKGLKTVINTNATKLTGDLSAALLSNNLDRIVFSFDTPDRERYESIRAGAVGIDPVEHQGIPCNEEKKRIPEHLDGSPNDRILRFKEQAGGT
jgi:MoaA/NifB/PqqE/SkfB family radical SAM enzyme